MWWRLPYQSIKLMLDCDWFSSRNPKLWLVVGLDQHEPLFVPDIIRSFVINFMAALNSVWLDGDSWIFITSLCHLIFNPTFWNEAWCFLLHSRNKNALILDSFLLTAKLKFLNPRQLTYWLVYKKTIWLQEARLCW